MKIQLSVLLSFCLIFSMTIASPLQAKSMTYESVIDKSPEDSYLFLFVERSAAYLDWSSASSLTKTALDSYLGQKFAGKATLLGHAQIGWHCSLGDGLALEGATGQTGQNNGQGINLLLSGWGLSLLQAIYTDGALESKQSVLERIALSDRNNNFGWIAFKIAPQQCLSLANFVKDYRDSGAAKNYGFPVEPLKYEGAGCTSFTNASILSAQLSLPIQDVWKREVKLPKELMGKLSKLPALTQFPTLTTFKNSYVSPFPFLLTEIPWASENEESVLLNYFDPELFYEVFVHMENQYRQSKNLDLKNPIRSKGYDRVQLHAKKVSEQWLQSLIENKISIKMEKIHSTTGLVIDLSQMKLARKK